MKFGTRFEMKLFGMRPFGTRFGMKLFGMRVRDEVRDTVRDEVVRDEAVRDAVRDEVRDAVRDEVVRDEAVRDAVRDEVRDTVRDEVVRDEAVRDAVTTNELVSSHLKINKIDLPAACITRIAGDVCLTLVGLGVVAVVGLVCCLGVW
ncbi:hypothetical protein DUI87_23526 [Hirundo rustica rustica]|uniref:Uncharacterized protein n=1 Tax=Hirundo rustica rustica TaxID=333673 RepID=A0A3M0JGL0_HIRRU|nr:hypothetical protein DUI87_23526 [Hirundo rustica rustica]